MIVRPFSSSPPSVAPPADKKKTIVVLDFNDAALGLETTRRPIGKQLAALLTASFAQRGDFRVVSQKDKEIAEEQNKSQSERRATSYAAQIGQLLSANLVVFGDILEYTIITESTGFGVFAQAKHEAKIGFTLSLVDVNTGEVRDAVTIQATANSKDTLVVGMGKGKTLSEDNKTSLLSEAAKRGVLKATNELVRLIAVPSGGNPQLAAAPAAATVNSASASPRPAAATNLQPTEKAKDPCKKKGFMGLGGRSKDCEKQTASAAAQANSSTSVVAPSNQSSPSPAAGAAIVVSISGDKIYVSDLPANAKTGTRLIVYRATEIKHPKTGKVLGTEEVEVGRLEVMSVKDALFTCKLTSGAGIKPEDLVKIVN